MVTYYYMTSCFGTIIQERQSGCWFLSCDYLNPNKHGWSCGWQCEVAVHISLSSGLVVAKMHPAQLCMTTGGSFTGTTPNFVPDEHVLVKCRS